MFEPPNVTHNARFIIRDTSYLGEYFILINDDYTEGGIGQRLEEVKERIRNKRSVAARTWRVQRYIAEEVLEFLNESSKIL